MSFNASKCVVMLPRSQQYLTPLLQCWDFQICGNTIEFVSLYSHLEHLITDGLDFAKRQGDFLGQVNSVLCFSNSSICCEISFISVFLH